MRKRITLTSKKNYIFFIEIRAVFVCHSYHLNCSCCSPLPPKCIKSFGFASGFAAYFPSVHLKIILHAGKYVTIFFHSYQNRLEIMWKKKNWIYSILKVSLAILYLLCILYAFSFRLCYQTCQRQWCNWLCVR